MALKVDEDYYSSVTELFSRHINKVEQNLEDFKITCDELFAENNFGSCLQEVLMELYTGFYSTAREQMKTLISTTTTSATDFVDDIETTDKL